MATIVGALGQSPGSSGLARICRIMNNPTATMTRMTIRIHCKRRGMLWRKSVSSSRSLIGVSGTTWNHEGHFNFYWPRSREIMDLIVSVRPFVCLSVQTILELEHSSLHWPVRYPDPMPVSVSVYTGHTLQCTLCIHCSGASGAPV